jgi:hypothetical protein
MQLRGFDAGTSTILGNEIQTKCKEQILHWEGSLTR